MFAAAYCKTVVLMLDQTGRASPISQRVVRVFVSSTFRDMHAERDELAKRVFPQLRKLCEERGVIWGDVDLRWGITDEQRAEGNVLPICLAEIERSRPYFMGILGDRYGWIPDEIPTEVSNRESWLADKPGRSVTELEIMHGVLNNPGMKGHAFFYFRSPAYIESLPAEEQCLFKETQTPEEIERYGREEAERRAASRRGRLERLKQAIRASGAPVRENYPDPRALGEMVLSDLRAVIEQRYPSHSQPGSLDRETQAHEFFAENLARGYVARQDYIERLDKHAEGSGPPMVVEGDSGSGKSSLLANWTLRCKSGVSEDARPKSFWQKLTDRQPHIAKQRASFVLMHFIGTTPDGADWASMLRRIMGVLQSRLSFQMVVPEQADALRVAFSKCLCAAAEKARIVIVIDGLDQLEDRDGALDLAWLPSRIPENIRLVLSTVPGKQLDELSRRGWHKLRVDLLNLDEVQQVAIRYLTEYGKTLAPSHMTRIIRSRQSKNPLYLRILLEELRIYGDHDTLDQRIDDCLQAQTIEELFQKLLARYEQDYEQDRPRLVGDVFSFLWATRQGLTEVELLELLSADEVPIPHAFWSPIYLASEQFLWCRSGLILIAHDSLRRAVRDRYLPEKQRQTTAHLRIADYLERCDFGLSRKHTSGNVKWGDDLAEYIWQLTSANAWERLGKKLGDSNFLTIAWLSNPTQVVRIWREIEQNTSLRAVEKYSDVLQAPERESGQARRVAMLLVKLGHAREAAELQKRIIDYFRRAGPAAMDGEVGKQISIDLYLGSKFSDSEMGRDVFFFKNTLASLLGEHAEILKEIGALDESAVAEQEMAQLFGELGNETEAAKCQLRRADLLSLQGKHSEAMALIKKLGGMFRKENGADDRGIALDVEAGVLFAQGKLMEAMALSQESESLYRETGNLTRLAAVLNNEAMIELQRGEEKEALSLFDECQRILRSVHTIEARLRLARILGSQGEILEHRGDFAGAAVDYREAGLIFLQFGKRNLEASCLTSLYGLLQKLCNGATGWSNEEVLSGYGELVTVCRRLGEMTDVSANANEFSKSVPAYLLRQATMLWELGRGVEGLPLAEDARQLSLQNGLVEQAHALEGLIAVLRGKPMSGMRTERKELACVHCEKIGDPALQDSDHQIEIDVTGQRVRFAQCESCFTKLRAYGYFVVRSLIGSYPEEQRNRAIIKSE
jgi:tetratricopeptide (TPR) repeat protein